MEEEADAVVVVVSLSKNLEENIVQIMVQTGVSQCSERVRWRGKLRAKVEVKR